jgi:arginyl-tRNA synthetase
MYKNLFAQDLQSYLKIKGLDKKINVSYSDFEDYQYQTPIAIGNKDIDSQDLANYLLLQPHYESVSITGKGFISVKFKLVDVQVDKKEPLKVLVDYCGVNVAKKMHIGHIRSMFIGDYITRLHQKNGDTVIKMNHIGDWGNQFGYLLHYIQKNNLENTLTNEKLTEYYKLANALNSENEEFSKESEQVAYKLQNNLDKNLHDLWKKCVNISMLDAEKTFQELGIKMTLEDTQGESFYAPFCKDVLEDLLNKGIAQKSEDSSVVIFFDKKSPLVIQKSNGNFLYALYDLAALKWRQENINPDKIVYVVDKRQALHFEQVFDVAKKAGYIKEDVILQHVGFGTILDKNKKPLKTKSGATLYLEDLFTEGKAILSNSEYFQNLEEELKPEILDKSIVGGMKFYDLKFNKNQDYIFDWQFVLNFSGGSAPYIQNAMTRIDSIFYKLGLDVEDKTQFNWSNNWNKAEKEIIFQAQKCFEIIQDSVLDYPSQTLCENIVNLCQLFHKYYESEMVIGSQEQDKKLNLLNYTYHSLKDNIDILGIDYYACKQKLLNIPKQTKLKN